MPSHKSVTSWSEDEPSTEVWSQVTFAVSDEPSPEALAPLLAAFDAAMANGGALSASFVVSGLTPTLRRWLGEDHGDQSPYVSRLLREPALGQALPEHLRPPHAVFNDERDNPDFAWMHPLYLAPSVTEQLHRGGAYDSGPTTAAAKAVVDAYIHQLIGERYEDFHVADSNHAWSGWFSDTWPEWDHTWLITDLRHNRATLLCVTDDD